MSNYSEFFLNGKSAVVELETIEISHPNFSKTYRVVRNNTEGITATLETGVSAEFEYYPVSVSKSQDTDDLDQMFVVKIGDLGDILPTEMDRVRASDNFKTRPVFIYRSYRSDLLTTILNGPITLNIKSIVFDSSGCKITAEAPRLNVNKTGEIYTLERFPMLKGTL